MANYSEQPWLMRIFKGKNALFLLFVAVAFISLNVYRMNDPLPVGSVIDNFEITNYNGITTNILDRNKPTVILFYKDKAIFSNAMYNATYRKNLPQYKFLEDKNIADIVVIVDKYDDYKMFKELVKDKRFAIVKPILYATNTDSVSSQFGVRSWPHMFVINESGVVIFESKLVTPEYIQKILWRN